MNKKQILKEVWEGLVLGTKLGLIMFIVATFLFVRQIGESVVDQNTLIDILAERIKHSEIINNEAIRAILKSEKELKNNIDGVLENELRLTRGLSDLLDYTNKIADATIQNAKKTKIPNLEKLINANVTVINIEKNNMGSGTIIKYKGKLYILSVAHLNGKSEICLNGEQDYRIVKTIKMDEEKDLALFELPEDVKNIDYIEISETYPKAGDKIWIVGNPFGLEDSISSGILSKHKEWEWYVTAPLYFGNSGGAVVNQEGKLIGISHALRIAFISKGRGSLSVGMVIDLETILDFLGEINDS